MIERNQTLTAPAFGVGPEGRNRLALMERSIPYAQHFMSDLENVVLAVHD